MSILDQKMPHLPHFQQNKNFLKIQNSRFKSFFNACHQVQFQKKSNKKIYRKVQKCQFWAEK